MKTGRIVALEVAHFSNGGNTEDLSRSVSRISMPQGLLGDQGHALVLLFTWNIHLSYLILPKCLCSILAMPVEREKSSYCILMLAFCFLGEDLD